MTAIIIVTPRRPSSMSHVIWLSSCFDSRFVVPGRLRHQHTVLRRFVIHIVERIIEPGVRRQHHWQRLIGRTIDGLLQAGHGVSDNVIDNYYSSNVSRHPRDGHDQSLIMINLSSWLSTSGHLSPWQHLTTIAPTSGWTS